MTADANKRASTPTRPIRAPLVMWAAFDRVCARLDTDRSAHIRAFMAEQIRQHGDAQDLADLQAAEQELAERRSRMHPGRPRQRST
jgi:hypothetical protein